MKKFLSIMLSLLMLFSSAYAELDLSSLSDRELEELISEAAAILESRKQTDNKLIDDPDVLYSGDDCSVYIDHVEITPNDDEVRLYFITINNSDLEMWVLFNSVTINGWGVSSIPRMCTPAQSKSRSTSIGLTDVRNATGLNSYADMNSIDVMVEIELGDRQILHHAHVVMTFDGEDMFVAEREYID